MTAYYVLDEMQELKQARFRAVASGMAGTALEAFDYAMYGQQAMLMEKLFFSGDGGAGFKALAVFAAGFLARPFGGLFFGRLSDRFGRNRALAFSMLLMALGTGGVGLLPTYAQIGIAAPAALTVLRLFQGFSMGGEYAGAVVYLTEFAGEGRRGLAGGLVSCAVGLGVLAGALAGAGLNAWLSPEDLEAWGWRAPFLLGGVVGLAGLFLRMSCGESPAFERARAAGALSSAPVLELFRSHKMTVLRGLFVFVGQTIPFYLNSVFFLQMAVSYLHMPRSQAFIISACSLAALSLTTPLGGAFSDRFGRRRWLTVATVFQLIAYPVIFTLFAAGEVTGIAVAWVTFGALLGLYYGATPVLQAEMFPVSVRGVGVAASCNAGAALFGGTAPMIGKALFEAEPALHALSLAGITSFTALGAYVTAAALAAAFAVWFTPEVSKERA